MPEQGEPDGHDLFTLIGTLRAPLASRRQKEFLILTASSQWVQDVDEYLFGLRGAGAWGVLRSARIEAPWLQLQVVDMSANARSEELAKVCGLADFPATEPEAAFRE